MLSAHNDHHHHLTLMTQDGVTMARGLFWKIKQHGGKGRKVFLTRRSQTIKQPKKKHACILSQTLPVFFWHLPGLLPAAAQKLLTVLLTFARPDFSFRCFYFRQEHLVISPAVNLQHLLSPLRNFRFFSRQQLPCFDVTEAEEFTFKVFFTPFFLVETMKKLFSHLDNHSDFQLSHHSVPFFD